MIDVADSKTSAFDSLPYPLDFDDAAWYRDYPLTLNHVANYIFLNFCVAACDGTELKTYYKDSLDFILTIIEQEKQK